MEAKGCVSFKKQKRTSCRCPLLLGVSSEEGSQVSTGFRDTEDIGRMEGSFIKALLHYLGILLKTKKVGVKVDIYLE